MDAPEPTLWKTREWGRTWVACGHGMPSSGCNPVRICEECFNEVLRRCEAKTRTLASKEK